MFSMFYVIVRQRVGEIYARFHARVRTKQWYNNMFVLQPKQNKDLIDQVARLADSVTVSFSS